MSGQRIHHGQLGHRAVLLAAAVFAGVVMGGAGFAPPDRELVARAVADPVGIAGEAVGDAGLRPAQPVAAGEQLKGLFKLDRAACKGGPVTGTYFRMIQPGGNHNGPWVENNDTACDDKSYTDLVPGKDGGLSTMGHQPHPDPAFDATGSGTNDRITEPRGFFGAKFATSTNPKDPQTGQNAPVPTITNEGGKLTGNLAAFAAAWNGQHFNQGSPKPDNSRPGITSGPSGTYDPATKHFVLEWTSTIVGGPFNNFTGKWHFEGTFVPGGRTVAQQLAIPDSDGAPASLDIGVPKSSNSGRAPERMTLGQTGAVGLKGLFRIEPAACSGPEVKGSYFRMIQPGGTASGPWVSNNDSTCADKSYTDLMPGKDGGLSTTGFQPQPGAPFDVTGSGTNDRITQPKGFFGTKFATATNEKDPQTGISTKLPEIVYDGAGKLSGNLSAFAAAWNGQHFNQGSPKPDGSKPGLTSGPEGTFDPTTKKFAIEWTTTIVGGPFNNFTGKWHFEGVYEGTVPGAVTAPAPTTGGGSTTTGSVKTTTGAATSTGAKNLASTTAAATAAAPVTTSGAAVAGTGLRTPISLPAVLIGAGLVCRRLGRRPGPCRQKRRMKGATS